MQLAIFAIKTFFTLLFLFSNCAASYGQLETEIFLSSTPLKLSIEGTSFVYNADIKGLVMSSPLTFVTAHEKISSEKPIGLFKETLVDSFLIAGNSFLYKHQFEKEDGVGWAYAYQVRCGEKEYAVDAICQYFSPSVEEALIKMLTTISCETDNFSPFLNKNYALDLTMTTLVVCEGGIGTSHLILTNNGIRYPDAIDGVSFMLTDYKTTESIQDYVSNISVNRKMIEDETVDFENGTWKVYKTYDRNDENQPFYEYLFSSNGILYVATLRSQNRLATYKPEINQLLSTFSIK